MLFYYVAQAAGFIGLEHFDSKTFCLKYTFNTLRGEKKGNNNTTVRRQFFCSCVSLIEDTSSPSCSW